MSPFETAKIGITRDYTWYYIKMLQIKEHFISIRGAGGTSPTVYKDKNDQELDLSIDRCPACGAKISESDEECSSCGLKIISEIRE